MYMKIQVDCKHLWDGVMVPGQIPVSGPCVKQVVTATLLSVDGRKYQATNHCDTPQTVCPRGNMPSGQGYELCKSICHQHGHAETNVIELAGENVRGGTIYVTGHTYACEACKTAAEKAGVIRICFDSIP